MEKWAKATTRNRPFEFVGIRGVHGSGWVGLEDFFDPTQKFGFVGLVTQPNQKLFQPNPLFSGWVRVGPKKFKKI